MTKPTKKPASFSFNLNTKDMAKRMSEMRDKSDFQRVGLQIIPQGTEVLATVTKSEWQTSKYDPNGYINIRWDVQAPEDLSGRVLFQKLRVTSDKDQTREQAIDMLGALNAFLFEDAEEPVVTGSEQVELFEGAAATLLIGVYDIDKKKGNYVEGVAPAANYEEAVA